ncbi:MAG: redoxin domain-containing protein [Deltaproteobacteria bacterium]|nr:redoxin domain-containing protein [Deltaproteobacteria bacterium]
MRDDYQRFEAQRGQILVVTRHDSATMRAYWRKEKLPFRGIADPDGKITAAYGQQWKLVSLGRMPAQFVVDCQGKIALSHYGKSMADIPPNDEVIATLRRLKAACPAAGS